MTSLRHFKTFSSLILLFVFLQDTQDGFKPGVNGGKDNEPSKGDPQGIIHGGSLNLF